jgi:S-formylglutathione hydrolase FrmB
MLAIGLVALGIVYAVLALTVFAPADRDGAEVVGLTVHSRDVGDDQGVQVVVPAADIDRTRGKPLLVFLHGHGGSDTSFTEDEAFFRALESLGGRAPVVAFPDGDEDSYWHDRATGRWGSYVTGEVIPAVIRRFHLDPRRVAIGGISMGGFGAYDIALKNPGTFCAVGGHSPALWFEGAETAPGAFENLADFERNNVVGTVQANPDAFGKTKVWIDYGDEDPFRPYDEGFVAAMEGSESSFTHHTWPGGHEGSYWGAHWPDYQRWYVKQLASC